MSQEPVQETSPRIKVHIKLGELSSKQRGAILGLVKDMGFVPEEIAELTVVIPGPQDPVEDGRRGKRK